MANGYFERGEMYDILFGDGLEGEMSAHRPGIIVSSDAGNRTCPTVLMVYTTTTTKSPISVNYKFSLNGYENWALCNQVVTVSKNRLKRCYGKLSPVEMQAIDGCLEKAFDLGYEDEVTAKELEDLRGEVARLKTQLDKANEGIVARSIEMNNYKKKYDMAVDRIVELELDLDIARRKNERVEEPKLVVEEQPVKEEEHPVPVVEFQREIVNINTASTKEIQEKLGVSERVAYDITGYRKKNGDFVEVEELLDVPKVSKPMFARIKDYIVIEEPEAPEAPEEAEAPAEEAPVVKEKVNVNTANIHELMAVGFGKPEAGRIQRWVRTYGPFRDLDDLTKVDGVTGKVLRKVRDKLEV